MNVTWRTLLLRTFRNLFVLWGASLAAFPYGSTVRDSIPLVGGLRIAWFSGMMFLIAFTLNDLVRDDD